MLGYLIEVNSIREEIRKGEGSNFVYFSLPSLFREKQGEEMK